MNSIQDMPYFRSQKGAATVESALTMLVFLLLVFGIIEFAMLIFRASSIVEATRAGARYLIVNDPVIDLDSYECDTLPGAASCGGNPKCDGAIQIMKGLYEPLTADQVYVQYRCSNTGYDDAYFHIYEVEVSVRNAEYRFMTPGILGIGASVSLPDFATSKISEDLERVEPEE